MTMPLTMRAMVLHAPGEALRAETRAVPRPGPEGVLLRVLACGICRTDLHVVDGELREPRLPLVPGHQIVGEVVARGARVAGFAAGERIGVPWLGGSCGDCDFCRAGEENLCDGAVYTGLGEWAGALPGFGAGMMRNFITAEAVSDRLFSLLVFLHIGTALFVLLGLWIHLQRLVRAATQPTRRCAGLQPRHQALGLGRLNPPAHVHNELLPALSGRQAPRPARLHRGRLALPDRTRV